MDYSAETDQETVVRLSSRLDIPDYSGVYFLIDCDEIVYVGQSINIAKRIRQHIKEGEKVFNRYYCFPLAVHELSGFEAFCILEHLPKYNKTLPPNDVFRGKEATMGICEVDETFLENAVSFGKAKIYTYKNRVLYDTEVIVQIRDGEL